MLGVHLGGCEHGRMPCEAREGRSREARRGACLAYSVLRTRASAPCVYVRLLDTGGGGRLLCGARSLIRLYPRCTDSAYYFWSVVGCLVADTRASGELLGRVQYIRSRYVGSMWQLGIERL